MTTSLPHRSAPRAFARDALTWLCYVLLAWFAYGQAAPGIVAGHLRDELGLDYSWVGLHVAAFAAGAMVAGVASTGAERRWGRRTALWAATLVMAWGTVGLTVFHRPELTVGSVLVMGLGGGCLLALIQAVLADHHGERRAVALAEANVAASVAYLVLIGMLTLAAWLGAGWRLALLLPLVVPLVAWGTTRRVAVEAPVASESTPGRLPRRFWVAAAMLFCTTAAEWCVTAWGATYVQDTLQVSTQVAVATMGGYFGGVLVGRVVGSRLARHHDAARLLAVALLVALFGYGLLWSAPTLVPALLGLAVLGLGLGNLFPMAMSVTVELEPRLAALASGRAVAMTSLAVLVAPLVVGSWADATSLRTALSVVPIALLLGALGLFLVRRCRPRPWRGRDRNG